MTRRKHGQSFLVVLLLSVVFQSLVSFENGSWAGTCDQGTAEAPEIPIGGWGDIPTKEISLGTVSQEGVPSEVQDLVAKINQKVIRYKSISKSNILNRVEALAHLQDNLSQALEKMRSLQLTQDSQDAIETLASRVKQKKAYLTGLLQIPQRLKAYDDFKEGESIDLASKFSQLMNILGPDENRCNYQSEQMSSPGARSVRGCTVIDAYRKDIVTQLDPALRDSSCILSLYDLYRKQNSHAPFEPDLEIAMPFFLWLEEFDLPETSRESRIRFRNDVNTASEVSSCYIRTEHTTNDVGRRLHFDKDGYSYNLRLQDKSSKQVLCNEQNQSIHQVPNGKYIYAVDNNGNIFIDKDRDLGGSRLLGHILLTRDFVLRSAGEIEFKDGKIKMLNSNSGHFQPTNEDVVSAARLLMKKYGRQIFSRRAEVRNFMGEALLMTIN